MGPSPSKSEAAGMYVGMTREELEAKVSYVREHRDELRAAYRRDRGEDREAEECRQRIGTLSQMIMKLYEDRVTGMVDDSSFQMLFTKCTTEKREKEERLRELEEKEQDSMGERMDKFLELVDGYEGFSREALKNLVEKIMVHEDGEHVDLVFRYVGVLEEEGTQAVGA